jgi:L-ribulose-5-phosphate 4-epimerase
MSPSPMSPSPSVADARVALVDLHQELVRSGLVAWTAGNVSSRARLDEQEVFVNKPSGVAYRDLDADAMIVCDLDGAVLEGRFAPSSDTAAHAYVYRHMPEVGGVVHTHSPYACAWAACKKPIPCVLTAAADEFGGPIPLGPFAIIGDDSIGRGIVATLTGHRSKAVLMASHGVFTIGRDARDAVKAAVMCEDVARSTHLAFQLGDPEPIPDDAVDALFSRYQNVYGQHDTTPPS